MVHVLIIEDDAKVAGAVSNGLRGDGYRATVANTAQAGMQYIKGTIFDVILLDLMLPGFSGLEILREIRRNGLGTPVLILTSKGSLDDRVAGLDAGADDYLVKPFAFQELLARVRALHRRASPRQELAAVLQIADLRLDPKAHVAVRQDTTLDLTPTEFSILECLLANGGSVVSREKIARDVWQMPVYTNTLDNVIDVHVARIRRKLDDPFQLKLLHTVRGVGFILRATEES